MAPAGSSRAGTGSFQSAVNLGGNKVCILAATPSKCDSSCGFIKIFPVIAVEMEPYSSNCPVSG